MLIIFDVDGTLIGGEASDWKSFEGALAAVLDFAPTEDFFVALSDITAQRIAEAAVRACHQQNGIGLEERIQEEYLERLRAAHAEDPQAFAPRPGAVALLDHLAAIPGVSVAIATGDWLSSISFKLSAAGIDVSRYPLATSCDATRRADIIRCAARRAGKPLAEAVYVGDGTWDLEACRELDVPLIGTGTRTDRLLAMGAAAIVEPFEIAPFMAALRYAQGDISALCSP
jgi:phosphoglycolate phosphatase-like HAD superfamily hydrolase